MPKTLFGFNKLNNKGIEKAVRIQSNFESLLLEVEKMTTGDERCKNIMRTKLEEACFYAKKSMATDPQNHVKEGI